MIRHIVLVKFPATARSDAIDVIFHELDDLRSIVPGMQHFFSGGNISPESLGRGFTHAFVADFADIAARDAYLVHPAHQTAGAKLVSAADGGIEGLIVIDIDIGG
jgi:Stress responsive A/B Barrel Domain